MCVYFLLFELFGLFYYGCHLSTLPYLLHTGYCHYIQFCSLLTGLRLLHAALLITYWLRPLLTATACLFAYYLLLVYCLLAALTLQGLLALCSIALFLPYWQALLTHSTRLHGILLTAYYLLTNYYLFAYSYNTLNNHANYHVSYW